MLKKLFYTVAILLVIAGGLIFYSWNSDEKIIMPVIGAGRASYDQNSFGAPRVGHRHKGVDIFAKKGTPVISATKGLVVFTGVLSLGGNVVLVFSPGLRFYYYAHLGQINTEKLTWVNQGDKIGAVGKTGNARTTPAHLHFSISRLNYAFNNYINPVPIINQAVNIKK